jgi:hypothetical protein
MRRSGLAVAGLVAVLAVASALPAVEHIQFDAVDTKSRHDPLGPESVTMVHSNGDTRVYPDLDKDAGKYDEKCMVGEMDDEDEETLYCYPPPTLGFKTLFRGAGKASDDNRFGELMNDVKDLMEVTGSHATGLSGAAVIPMVHRKFGPRGIAISTIDGGRDGISSLWNSELHMSMNASKKLLTTDAVYVREQGIDAILSPTAPFLTPWCTSMFAEQIAPDAKVWDIDTFPGLKEWFHLERHWAKVNPYNYGWPMEARVKDYESASIDAFKRYAMGRMSWNNVYCAPDGQTCVGNDDGVMVAFVSSNRRT